MNNKKIFHIAILLFLPIIVLGQESNPIEQKHQINSYVKLIDNTEKEYIEGIAEGPILNEDGSESEAVGGWTAYYLHENPEANPPLRIRLNIAFPETYEQYDFYYRDQNLVYAKLKVDFYEDKEKDEIFEKTFYFLDGEVIVEGEPELLDYTSDSIKLTDKFVRSMLYN